MRVKAGCIFFLTLGLYCLTVYKLSYVGVYLTYIAFPVILVSFLIMIFSRPKPEHKEIIDNSAKSLSEVMKVISNGSNHLNQSLKEFNKSLEKDNKQREKIYEEDIHKLIEEVKKTSNNIIER